MYAYGNKKLPHYFYKIRNKSKTHVKNREKIGQREKWNVQGGPSKTKQTIRFRYREGRGVIYQCRTLE